MAKAALPAPAARRSPGRAQQIGLWLTALLLLTMLAGGTGAGLGVHLSEMVERTVSERIEAQESASAKLPRYNGDFSLTRLGPVIANLATPTEVWIRLETAIVYANGSLQRPDVTASEIREDILAYVRTLSLEQLQGPSALQHLREDLNERAVVRTNGKVDEVIIETLVLQ
jgi:flagellar FliL protein